MSVLLENVEEEGGKGVADIFRDIKFESFSLTSPHVPFGIRGLYQKSIPHGMPFPLYSILVIFNLRCLHDDMQTPAFMLWVLSEE